MCVWREAGSSYQVGDVPLGHGPERQKERRRRHLLARRVDVPTEPAVGVLVSVVVGHAPIGRHGGGQPPG